MHFIQEKGPRVSAIHWSTLVPFWDRCKHKTNIQSMRKFEQGTVEFSRGFLHRIKHSRNKPVYFWYPLYSYSFFTVSAEVYDSQLSPLEAVVLNAMLTGSSVLNLKGHFLSQLPDLRGLAGTLTRLNLSFNQLWVCKSVYWDLVMNIFVDDDNTGIFHVVLE